MIRGQPYCDSYENVARSYMWSPPSFLQKSQPLAYRYLYTPITCHLLTQISVKKVRMFLADIYLFKFNHENTRTMYEIRSKLTKKIPEWRQCYSCVFIITFEQISHIFDVFIVNSEQVSTGRVGDCSASVRELQLSHTKALDFLSILKFPYKNKFVIKHYFLILHTFQGIL